MFMVVSPSKINYSRMVSPSPSSPWRTNTITTSKHFFTPLNCAPLQQPLQEEEQSSCFEGCSGVMCESCKGKGWLLCVCGGQKTNVKAENKWIYRRCPSCRAIGYLLCPKCKVFKCITFPNYSDGEDHLSELYIVMISHMGQETIQPL